MESRKRIFVVFFSIFLCIACDQLTKETARPDQSATKSIGVVKGILSLDYVVNKGGVFAFE